MRIPLSHHITPSCYMYLANGRTKQLLTAMLGAGHYFSYTKTSPTKCQKQYDTALSAQFSMRVSDGALYLLYESTFEINYLTDPDWLLKISIES